MKVGEAFRHLKHGVHALNPPVKLELLNERLAADGLRPVVNGTSVRPAPGTGDARRGVGPIGPVALRPAGSDRITDND